MSGDINYKKFSLPETVSIKRWRGHDISDDICEKCKMEFIDLFYFTKQVSCGYNMHLCGDCYENLDDEDP